MKRNLFVCMAAMGIAGSMALSAQAATDLAGADMTVTSLVGDEVFENSSATAATLTLDLADDVTWTGSVSGPVNLVKTGAGTLTVDGDGYQGTGGISISNGILKLGHNCGSRALGVADTVVTINGGTLDINYPSTLTTDAACIPRDTITHDVILHVAGTGFNGFGTITNSIGNTHYKNKAFGRIVLDDDAAIATCGRMDLEKSTSAGFDYKGTGTFSGAHTVTFLGKGNVSGAEFGGMSDSTWTPSKIVLAPTSTLGFEGSPTVNVPGGIEMHDALLAFTDAAPKGSTSIHVKDGVNNLRIGRGSNARFTTPVTVDEGATLKLIQMDGTGANYTDKIWSFASVVTNNGTFSINTARHIISSTGFENNGTLTLDVDNCMFSNIVFTAPGTINGATGRMQFYGTFTSTNEDTTMTTTTRGIDFHPTSVTLKGKTLTLAPAPANTQSVWFGGGQKQLVADGPVVLSPTGGADVRAYSTDFPVAPSITVNLQSGKALTFQTSGRFATPTNAPRTAYLNGACYLLPTTPYSTVTLYNFLDHHQDVRTVVTNANWDLLPATSGLHLGTTSSEADVALGANARIETSLVQFQSAADHVARLALETGSTLTLTGNGGAMTGFFVTSTYYQSGSSLALNGGTLKAGSDWDITYTRRDSGNPMPHPPYWGVDVVVGSHGGESTIDLNGHDVGLTAGLRGLGDLAVTGDGNMRGGLHMQGRLAGNVSVSGAGVKDLSGAATMSNLTVAAGSAVKLGVGGTNCVKMAYMNLKNVGGARRDQIVYDNMDEAMAYDGDFPYRPTSLGLVHGQFRVANGDSVLADGSAAIYEGQFYAPTTDTYTFAGMYSNGIELKIDGARVFQSVGYEQSQSGTCELTEGWHDFRVVVMNMGSIGSGQDMAGWHDAGMGLGWTNAVVDAASISNAPTGLIRFDTDTLPMRPGAPLASTAGLVNWKRAPFAKDTEPTKEETAAEYAWDTDTTTNTMVFLNKRYGNGAVPAGWPVANAVAEVSGWFLVPEGQGGEWMFTTCFDNSVYFWVDDEEGFFAGYNPPTTNWCHLASGWHKFKIRTADKGGAVGSTSARNGECAVRAKRPGGSLVAFDERNFAIRASMDDLFDALPNGIAGNLTLGAGAVVSNVSATGGCPVRGTVSGAGTLAGQWLLTGDATLTYADVPKTVRDLGDYGPRFTDAQAALFRHGGHVTVAFAEQPTRQNIKVCPAGGLEGLSSAELAAHITCTVAGGTATWFEPGIKDGWLYLNNLRASATIIVFR
ncbi:MAG: hypothetical protein IJL17_18500 [Kiritimatiellae bacterium]|nr:hypothetical protein [Kiritimatiellia bacterium]